MAAPKQIEYAVGLRFPEGVDTSDYDYIVGLPDYEPEKHELFAHLLLMAVRKEWAEVERLRQLQLEQHHRERRRVARAAAKLAQVSGNEGVNTMSGPTKDSETEDGEEQLERDQQVGDGRRAGK